MHVCPECGDSLDEPGFYPADGTQLAAKADDALLGESVGQYRIARLLGVGGMGRVYKAVQPAIGSRVAVKVLSRDCADNRELVERFFAEARAVNVIRHENIINVLDLATLPDGRPYITMEYLDGQPLADVMESGGQLPVGSLARLVGEVLDALRAAHSKGIIHRDLKPDNIFVSPQGHAKVLDFGIAKLMPEMRGEAAATRTGSLLGTPQYMSPEQASAQPVDARTDIYAMGVILYEGVTGRRPFAGNSLFELLRQVLEQDPVPPRSLRSDLPPAYEALILRTMAKDPAQRFQTAGELADALAAAVNELPQPQWAPINAGAGSTSARIGPPSVPTPGHVTPPPTVSAPGGPVAVAARAPMAPTVAPQSAATPLAPTMAPQAAALAPPAQKSKAPLFVALGLVVLVGIGAAVMLTQGGSSKNANAKGAADSGSSTANTKQAQPAGKSTPTPGGTTAAVNANDVQAQIKATTAQIQKQIADTQKKALAMVKKAQSAKFTVPGTYQPSGFDPAKFDVTKFVAEAKTKATEIYRDAVLVRIDAVGVRPNGHADLTLDTGFTVIYRFASPSRGKRPASLPRGVEFKPSCMVYVYVDRNGVRPYPLHGRKCDMPLLGEPHCSAAAVWKRAARRGAPTANSVARLGYWAGPHKHGRWYFRIDTKHSFFLPDNC